MVKTSINWRDGYEVWNTASFKVQMVSFGNSNQHLGLSLICDKFKRLISTTAVSVCGGGRPKAAVKARPIE